jgi:hypothetical protein
MMTHRVFSRNSASSRAIPVEKMLKKVEEDPFIPTYWGKNQKGMQADQELLPSECAWSETTWLEARNDAVQHAKQLLAIGVHKQITNRLLEPWLWHTVIVTATEWDNFWGLRCNKDAQPEIKRIADMMREIYDASIPKEIWSRQWHMPLMTDLSDLIDAGFSIDELCRISVGRCARVSYLTHNGIRDPRADLGLCDRLLQSGHMSPLEHIARPMCRNEQGFSANFRGWVQLRKDFPNEENFSKTLSLKENTNV